MASPDYVGPTAVRAAVLPARVAYLVTDGSEGGLRRAVQEACTRWGGMAEPIIPVKAGGEFDPWCDQLVSLADVDVAVNVDVPPDDATAAAAALGLELVPLTNIDTVGLSAFTVHPSATGPAYEPGYVSYVIAREVAALWEVVGAGDLTAEHVAALPAGLLEVRRAPDDEVARAQIRGGTLVERTCSQFGENWASGGPTPGPAIVWVTEQDSFSDCTYFWNLRALRPLRFGNIPMLLIPVGVVQHWLNFSSQFAYTLERPDEFAPDVVLRSGTVAETALDETASLLGLKRYEGKPRIGRRMPAPTRKAPFTYLLNLDPRAWLTFERSYGELTDVDVQLFRDKTTVRFTSPVSFSTQGGRALVRLSGAALAGLPRRPAVASLIHSGSEWRDNALQLTVFAVNDHNLELHIPELREVTNALLGSVTIRHELSSKGKPGVAWLDLTNISPLMEPGVFAAIRELTTPRSKELLRELQKLRADGAVDKELAEIAAHWGGRSERKYRSAEQLKGILKKRAPRVLERLCEAGWAERGVQVICGTCGLPSFVTFAHTLGRATCPGCSSPANYEVGSALTVYYRLNSHLDLLSDQGVLPHLLTIAALERQGQKSCFLPGVDVWFSKDDSDKAEADIFGVRDGQVFAGEVKTSASEFTPDQVTRDVALSSRLQADMHILAAPDDIPKEVVEKAEKECETNGLGLVVLQRADLLPGG